jgi:hypothetical protein
MYKTKLPLFASKEKHVEKNYLFLHKEKIFPIYFNGQNFFFWLTPWGAQVVNAIE